MNSWREVEEGFVLRTGKHMHRLTARVVIAAIGAAVGASGAISQGRIGTEMPPDVDLDSQFLDLGELSRSTNFAISGPQDKDAAAPFLPRKSSAPDMRLEWVGIGNSPDGLDSKSNAGAGPTNLGVKVKMRPPITLGVLAEFDQPGETLPGARAASDRNWLAAATGSMQVLPGLSLDTRAAWGPSETDAIANTPAGHRRLFDVRLAKKEAFGAWRFSPTVSVNYLEERRNTTAAAPDLQAAQTIGSGRVDVRPELAYRLELENSMFVEPKAMIGGFWDIGAPLGTGTDTHAQMRLKGEASVTIGSTHGTKVEVGGGVEEGTEHAPDVWSGRMQLSVPLK